MVEGFSRGVVFEKLLGGSIGWNEGRVWLGGCYSNVVKRLVVVEVRRIVGKEGFDSW